jgi:Flp pilus assembly protein TadG
MKMLLAPIRAWHHGDHAQALVEFAFVLPIFLLVVTGLIDVARAVWEENTLAYAAREGTRYAIVHGAGGNPRVGPIASTVNPTQFNTGNIVTVVRNAAVGVGNIDVTVEYPLGNNRGQPVTVDATAQFVPLPSYYLLGSAFQITLRGGSSLYIQR